MSLPSDHFVKRSTRRTAHTMIEMTMRTIADSLAVIIDLSFDLFDFEK